MLGEGEAGVPIEIHLSNVQTSQSHVSFPKLFQLYGHGVSHGRPKFGDWTLYLCWNDRHLTQASNGLTKQEEMAFFMTWHFQSHSKCPSQPTNYSEMFLKETLHTVFQSGLRDFTQFSKEGKLQPGVAGRAYFKLTRMNCLLFIETASPYVWIY